MNIKTLVGLLGGGDRGARRLRIRRQRRPIVRRQRCARDRRRPDDRTRHAATSSLGVAQTPLGAILVDGQGRTLYALTKDSNGTPTCTGACAVAWPPAMVNATVMAGPGITAPTTVVDAPGGGKMLKAGKWPLYRFAGDTAPGETNGQGSGGMWFVVGADGQLIKS